ncbi:Alpha/beta-hydrolase [Mycena venus]|uniref:Alpha/beta-hydrolase n=1 Tax=Mycena venus TaxID=2733690 RepID=A0A8H6TZ98_9AGAR|nr:Alpha/beta-hydrolase [Mycena venus]
MSTAANAKPTIIIIPGAFSPLAMYDPVIASLQAHGYTVHGVELESVGGRAKGHAAPAGMYDDAAKAAALAARLADEGAEVVLVAHSYGGVVASEAAKGLARSVRTREGKKGGIVRIVFVAAVVPREGETSKDVLGNPPPVEYVGLEDGHLSITDPVKGAPIIFSDLPLDEAVSWTTKFSTHSPVSFGQKVTYAAYKDIPISYVLCENNVLITPAQQEKIIAALEGEMGGETVDRHPVQCGHGINVSQPGTMVDVIRRILGDTE